MFLWEKIASPTTTVKNQQDGVGLQLGADLEANVCPRKKTSTF